MYKRFTKNECKKLRNECYYDDPLFVTYINSLNDFSLKYHDLGAEEIWNEARRYARQLGKAKRPDKEVSAIYNELVERYTVFLEKGVPRSRTEEESERTAVCVLMCILYMLCTTEDEQNPYDRVCAAIGNKISKHFIVREIYDSQRSAEKDEEENGVVVPFKDYMKEAEVVEIEIKMAQEKLQQTSVCIRRKFLETELGAKIEKTQFELLIDDILGIDGLLDSMMNSEFNGFTEFNRTLFCNIIGMMKRGNILSLSYDNLSKNLGFGVSVKSYLMTDVSKHSRYLSKHKRQIDEIIKKYAVV